MGNHTITSPKGFWTAGVTCGIKKSKKLDLGLIVCPTSATAAVVFTTNKIVSAAVEVCREHVKSPKAYAVVVNSGNANACTGNQGIRNAQQMCAKTASLLNTIRNTQYSPREVLVASTGIIGEQLPMAEVNDGIKKAAGKLSDSAKAGLDFAKAIMTTDIKPKYASRQINVSGCKFTIAGCVKGAGMIAPNMATTLCFITTDAAITKPLLNKALKMAIGGSLNKLTVDGLMLRVSEGAGIPDMSIGTKAPSYFIRILKKVTALFLFRDIRFQAAELTGGEIIARLGEPSLRIIDSRIPERYRGEFEPIDPIAGRIPGALNAPHPENIGADGLFLSRAQLRLRFEPFLQGTQPENAIFYCGSGVTAARNALAMTHAGLGDARLYAGSWSEWITDPSHPIEKD